MRKSRTSMLDRIDDVWFGEHGNRTSDPAVLRMTPGAHRRAVHEVGVIDRQTPGGNRRRPSFDRYGPCIVRPDLPDNFHRQFFFA